MRTASSCQLQETGRRFRKSLSIHINGNTGGAGVRMAISAVLVAAAVSAAAAMCMAAGKGYGDPTRFEAEIRAFEEKDRQQRPPRGAIVCIGSSTIKGWRSIRQDLAPLTIIARGFGGSNMNDALHYMDRIVLPYAPRAVVVYEGDNDIAQGIAPEKIRDTFRAFTTRLHRRFPNARVYFLSIKPSSSRWTMWPRMQEANKLIARECSRDSRMTYVDMTASMLDADGQVKQELFLGDKLHLNAEGYELWRDTLKPVLINSELSHER